MTTTATDLHAPTLPLELIHVHPNNPRRNATADDELIDSVVSLGIAQALTVMPYAGDCLLHGDQCYTLAAGHRRRDAAEQAGLREVPVMLRDDLVTDAQQIEFMCVENLHRVDLTPVEEAEAYEQLVLQGMDVDAIAKATGRKAAMVTSRLELLQLPESARERLHAGEMTLLDAAAMQEFADDAEVTAALESQIGTGNFRWAVEEARRARIRKQRRDAQVADLEELGAKQVDEVRDGTQPAVLYFDSPKLKDPAAHDGCLAYVVPASEWQDPYLVCTKPDKHPRTKPKTPETRETSEWEKQQEARQAVRVRRAAASAVRLAWLREHFTGMFPTRSHSELAKAAHAFLPGLILDPPDTDAAATLVAAFGATPDPTESVPEWQANTQALKAYAADLTAAKPTKVLESLAGFLAALVAGRLDLEEDWFTDPDELLHQLVLWDWLKTAGYELSDVDKETRTELEVKHTQLISEAEAEAS